MARFLGKSFSEDQLEKLRQHLTFENLSKNSAVNKEDGKTSGSFNENGNFMRKGTGDPLAHQLIPEKEIESSFNSTLLYCFHFPGNSKGETGDWEKHFSPELSRKIDEWTELNLRGSDITFVDKI